MADFETSIGAKLDASWNKVNKKIKADLETLESFTKRKLGGLNLSSGSKSALTRAKNQFNQVAGVYNHQNNLLAKATLKRDKLYAKLFHPGGQAKLRVAGRAAIEKRYSLANAHVSRLTGSTNAALMRQNAAMDKYTATLYKVIAKESENANSIASKIAAEKALANELRRQKLDTVNRARNIASSRMNLGMGMLGTSAVIAGGIYAVTSALREPTEVAMQFEKNMSAVKAVTSATAKEMNSLNKEARRVAERTVFNPKEVAGGMKFLGMSGMNPLQIKATTQSIASLAASGDMDLPFTADKLTNIMMSFNMVGGSAEEVAQKTQRAADVIAWTANHANVNIAQLAETMKYVGLTASQYGTEKIFEEMAVSIGILGDYGLQGSMAGTSLRATMIKLAGPSAQAAAAMKKVGLVTKDAQGNMLPFSKVLTNFAMATQNMGSGDRLNLAKKLFDIRAAGPAAALAKDIISGKFGKRMADIDKNIAGYADKVAKIRMDNLWGDIEYIKSAAMDIYTTIYESVLMPLRMITGTLLFALRAINTALKIPILGPMIGFGIGSFITLGIVIAGLAAALLVAVAPMVMLSGQLALFNSLKKTGMLSSALAGVGIRMRSAGLGGNQIGLLQMVAIMNRQLPKMLRSVLISVLGVNLVKKLDLIYKVISLKMSNILSRIKTIIKWEQIIAMGRAAALYAKGSLPQILVSLTGFLTKFNMMIAILSTLFLLWASDWASGLFSGIKEDLSNTFKGIQIVLNGLPEIIRGPLMFLGNTIKSIGDWINKMLHRPTTEEGKQSFFRRHKFAMLGAGLGTMIPVFGPIISTIIGGIFGYILDSIAQFFANIGASGVSPISGSSALGTSVRKNPLNLADYARRADKRTNMNNQYNITVNATDSGLDPSNAHAVAMHIKSAIDRDVNKYMGGEYNRFQRSTAA